MRRIQVIVGGGSGTGVRAEWDRAVPMAWLRALACYHPRAHVHELSRFGGRGTLVNVTLLRKSLAKSSLEACFDVSK